MTEENKQVYYLVAGKVEYIEDGQTKSMMVDGVFPDTNAYLTADALGKIQVLLQMRFHSKYSKTHPAAPDITDVIIYSISSLGYMTPSEFAPKVEPSKS